MKLETTPECLRTVFTGDLYRPGILDGNLLKNQATFEFGYAPKLPKKKSKKKSQRRFKARMEAAAANQREAAPTLRTDLDLLLLLFLPLNLRLLPFLLLLLLLLLLLIPSFKINIE
jgi:hypothetical protein